MEESGPSEIGAMRARLNALEADVAALRVLLLAILATEADPAFDPEKVSAIIARSRYIVRRNAEHGDTRRQVGADKTHIALEKILAGFVQTLPPPDP